MTNETIKTTYEDLEAQGRLVILPCAVGDCYFTIENFCDEHGKLDEPAMHDSYDCACCCKPCNAKLGVVERKFHSVYQILEHERLLGKYVFLTRTEAKAAIATRKAKRKETAEFKLEGSTSRNLHTPL